MITVGGDDRVLEMLPDGTLVWEYGMYDPGLTFRVEKYALDYPAFIGKDLSPGEVLEFPASEVPCSLVDVNDNYLDTTNVWLSNLKVRLTTSIVGALDLSISSIEGKILRQSEIENGGSVDVSDLMSGIYLVTISDPQTGWSNSYKVIR